MELLIFFAHVVMSDYMPILSTLVYLDRICVKYKVKSEVVVSFWEQCYLEFLTELIKMLETLDMWLIL